MPSRYSLVLVTFSLRESIVQSNTLESTTLEGTLYTLPSQANLNRLGLQGDCRAQPGNSSLDNAA